MGYGGGGQPRSQALASSPSPRDGDGCRNTISHQGDASAPRHIWQAGSPSQPSLSCVFTTRLGCFYNQAFVVLKNEHNYQNVVLLSYPMNKMVSL